MKTGDKIAFVYLGVSALSVLAIMLSMRMTPKAGVKKGSAYSVINTYHTGTFKYIRISNIDDVKIYDSDSSKIEVLQKGEAKQISYIKYQVIADTLIVSSEKNSNSRIKIFGNNNTCYIEAYNSNVFYVKQNKDKLVLVCDNSNYTDEIFEKGITAKQKLGTLQIKAFNKSKLNLNNTIADSLVFETNKSIVNLNSEIKIIQGELKNHSRFSSTEFEGLFSVTKDKNSEVNISE